MGEGGHDAMAGSGPVSPAGRSEALGHRRKGTLIPGCRDPVRRVVFLSRAFVIFAAANPVALSEPIMNQITRARGARRQMRALGIGATFALCAVASACPPGPGTTLTQLPECPTGGVWSTFFAGAYREIGTGPGTSPGEIPLSGMITDIPEFNDCQRFLVRQSSTMVFDSLFAIFARLGLDSMEVDTSGTLTGAGIIPMATIYSFHSAYPQLGIEADFNCLYFIHSTTAKSGYEARIVPVQTNAAKCLTSPTASGTPLQVDRVLMTGADVYDYPPVARWDWDSTAETQFIGIRCGRAWCEVRARESRSALASTPRYTRSGSVLYRRAVEIKGWHDEQRLAVPPAPGAPAATPSGIVATLIPDTLLDHDPVSVPAGSTRYNASWVRVASVALSAPPGIYASKFNLVQSAAPDPVNTVYFCYGPLTSSGHSPCFSATQKIPNCPSGGQWWARIEANPAYPQFYCVTRRPHPNFKIPGIVRWRWTLHDDTMWVRCLDGCCQVQPHH